MSNQHLGNVYSKIIDDVIASCNTTFEEDGVSNQTLQDLKATWQNKLSALKVGTFPWEPPPPPQPMITLPSNVSSSAAVSMGNLEPPGARIKLENDHLIDALPILPPNYGNNDARERAVANLQEKFGADANVQINQIQKQMLPNSAGPGPFLEPKLEPHLQKEIPGDYTGQQQHQLYRQMDSNVSQPHLQAQPVGPLDQTDGAAEWQASVLEQRGKLQESTRAGYDLTLHEQMLRRNQALEGGGLLLTRSEKAFVKHRNGGARSNRAVQVDGGLDDDDDVDEEEDTKPKFKDELFDENEEDEDDDAINSDLDDPDENEIEDEGDEGKPTQVMLCTYDRVQRVKNKWKCTLRDGVVNSGGKEYVFGKANGEFEW